MEKMILSEKSENCRYLSYAASALAAIPECSLCVSADADRVSISADVQGRAVREVRRILHEKIVEIICVGYKYGELRSSVRVNGLTEGERELLLTALLAADFNEDARYVRERLQGIERHSVDGFYKFRLSRLREKWLDVSACVPQRISSLQLKDFMRYLLSGGKGKVFLRGGEVYDSHCRRLRRSVLMGETSADMRPLQEIVISGADCVECIGTLRPEQESVLRRYYVGDVYFSGDKF